MEVKDYKEVPSDYALAQLHSDNDMVVVSGRYKLCNWHSINRSQFLYLI